MATTRRLDGSNTVLRIYFGESDRIHRKPFSDYVFDRAREHRLAGCTVFRALTGYGATSIVRTATVFALSADLPMVIEIVDERARIEAFLAQLDPVMPGCLVTLQDVEVRHYHPPAPERGPKSAP